MGNRLVRVVPIALLAVALATPAGRVEAAAPVFGPATPITADATTDTGDDSTPRIVSDGRGTWITMWAATSGLGGTLATDSDVLAARSRDLGASWSTPVPVNADAASDTEFDFAPALATDGAGTWVAVWVATNGADTDIFVARSLDAGATWTAKQPLHADAATDAANDDHPQIATDGAGTWVVVWDANGRTGSDRDVFSARSIDGGVTWSAPAPLNADATTDRGTDQRPQLATDGHGRWVAVWASNDTLGGTKGNDFDILTAYSTDGALTWSAPALLNTNATTDKGLDDRPQITTDRQGTWVAVWASDENLGGTLGTDLDLLTARSTDGGITWSAPAALNTNAATDSGEDGAPALATDGAGTWVVVWESNDSLGGTIGADYDVLMAHSVDGGAHWSAPRALDPAAATDGRRDIAPQIATAGGVWNVVWSASGDALGTDRDVLRSGGRAHCGDGVLDPGEQCDDGNTQDGDGCPSTCEFPPSPATPVTNATPGSGGTPGGSGSAGGAPSSSDGGATPSGNGVTTPSDGTSPTIAGSPTSGGDPGATPSNGPTPDPFATPTVADSPSGSASPGPSATSTGPLGTATTDPLATSTPVSSGAGTPTPAGATPHGTDTTSNSSGATPAGPGPTPQPGATFAGGLADTTRAKAAVGCQRAVLAAGAQVLGARLANLGSCGRAMQHCIQTKPDDPSCLDAAGARCRSALAGFAKTDAKQSAAIRKRCGGALALGDVLAPAGLGFDALTCGDEGTARSLDDLVECVVGEHACRGATLFELLQPRAKEWLRLPAMNASTLDSVVCLPDHGGDGASVGDPAGQGKAVDACAGAIVKAGTTFVRTRLTRLAKCTDGLFSCVQLAPGDGACLAKARARCDQADAASAADERKLTSAVSAKCAESVVAYATLRAARAANLDALAAACAAVGVPELATLADYQQCVLRADACRVDGVVRVQAPRIAELLAVVGRSFGSSYCGSP